LGKFANVESSSLPIKGIVRVCATAQNISILWIHPMFSHRFTSCVVPALSLLLFVQSADAQQGGFQSPPSRDYYAVIGAVGVPGAYEYSSGLPTLADVIHAADGLTSEASGTFRLVREGKASQQMFYSPDSKMRLLSGDILIMDKSLSGTQGRGRSSAAADSQSRVWIVAMNLIHRPVVMSLPSESATLERLVSQLNQSPNVIPTVKILQAKTSGYIGPEKNLAKFRLISESVLIFDPSFVRIGQIPILPPAYPPKVTTAFYRQIRSASSEDTRGENSKSIIKLAAGSSWRGGRSQLDQAENRLWTPASLESVPNPKAKLEYEIPEFWTPIKKDEPSTKPQANDWKIAPKSPPMLPPADPLAFLPDEKGVPESAEKSTVPAETSEITNPFRTLVLPGSIAVVCVGLLGAGWFIRKKFHQRVKSHFDFQPVKKRTEGILDALIENKMSVVEEAIIFPKGLELQISATPPVSRKSFRVDFGHQILRPRLPSVIVEPVLDSPQTVTKTTQIDAVPETPAVVSGLSEPVEILQQKRDVPRSESLPVSVEAKTEIDETRFPETEPYTGYVYSTMWSEPASESEPVVEISSETPSRNESASYSHGQTNRLDSPQTTSLRPHARYSGWVLDRVLVALHGVTRQ
jgi:hypothetical protein